MATSGTTTFSLTGQQALQQVFDILEFDRGSVRPNEDFELGRVTANLMLKSWQADGCHLWRETDITITWPADEPEVTLDANYIDISELRHQVSATNERPLARVETGEYLQYPNKAQSGNPLIYSPAKTRTTLKLRVWPVPSENVTLLGTGTRVTEDLTSINDDWDVPQEWLETVIYCLADRLIEPLDVALHRPATVQRVQARAQSLFTALRDMDRPASIYFTR